jgi:hypothetical protein
MLSCGMLTTVETVPTVIKGLAYIESPGKVDVSEFCVRMLRQINDQVLN